MHVGADTETFSLKAQNNVGHGRYLYETVGGSGQRLVSNLVGEGTQCKPLKVDLSYHKTGYTGGAMLLRSVPGFASCRQTCYIPNYTAALVLGLVQLQGSLTAIVENRLASNVLGHLPSASSSFAAITPASSAGWGGCRPNGLSAWHAMQGRGSALPHAIRSARASMQRPCTRPPWSHGTCTGAFMPPKPSIGSSRAHPQ